MNRRDRHSTKQGDVEAFLKGLGEKATKTILDWANEGLRLGEHHHETDLYSPISIHVGNLDLKPLEGLERVREIEINRELKIWEVWTKHGGTFVFLDPGELKVWLENQYAILRDDRWWLARTPIPSAVPAV